MKKQRPQKPSYHRTTLFFKTFTLFSLIVALLIALFAVLTISRQKSAVLKIIDTQANSLSNSIARVCKNAIILGDYGFVVEYAMGIVRESPHILYIVFIRQDGFSLFHTAQGWEQRDTLDAQWMLINNQPNKGQIQYSELVDRRVFHYTLPLGDLIVPWGAMHLGISLEDFNREISTMYFIMSVLILFCLCAGLLSAYGFARKLTQPILKLNRLTRQIARGNLEARVNLTTHDEIEDLAHSFNHMAEALQEITVSKNFFNNIIQNMSESLIVTDSSGNIRMLNEATLTLLDYQEHELLDRPLMALFGPHAHDHHIAGLFDETKHHQRLETLLFSKHATPIPVLFSSSPLLDTRGLVCVALDIRRQKNAEKNLKLAYKELKDTQAQLIQTAKLASIGELAAGVAHELNQPLMIIRTTIQFYLRQFTQNRLALEGLREDFESVEQNTSRMMKIISHLRTFSRQSQTVFSTIDINLIVNEVFLMLAEQLRLRDIIIDKKLATHLPKIRGNANQLEQVVLNLIINARDAITQTNMPGGRLEVCTGISAQQDFVEVHIKDNGSGIPIGHQDKIFDPFFTTKDVGKGTGLGLSISYGIIKEHRGEIKIAETGGTGTHFMILLPISTPSMKETP